MKIALSWLLDHINVIKQEVDVLSIVKRFNVTTAEIDDVETVHTDLASLYAVRITEVKPDELVVESLEGKKSVSLPVRKDPKKDVWYLMKKDGDTLRWATLSDVGSGKDGLLPSMYMTEEQAKGSWRNEVEQEDTIITIDNKAITNRPDLWGHRGCTREVAALLEKELVAEESILADTLVKHYDKKGSGQEFTLAIEFDICRRFAGLSLPKVEYRASLPWMAFRLARVDSKPRE